MRLLACRYQPVPVIAYRLRSLPLYCKQAFFISYTQWIIFPLIRNTMKNTMLRNPFYMVEKFFD